MVSFGELGLSSGDVDELFREMRENTQIDVFSDTCSDTLIDLGPRRQFSFSFRNFFRHFVCAPS